MRLVLADLLIYSNINEHCIAVPSVLTMNSVKQRPSDLFLIYFLSVAQCPSGDDRPVGKTKATHKRTQKHANTNRNNHSESGRGLSLLVDLSSGALHMV